jgi:hypothetical protein
MAITGSGSAGQVAYWVDKGTSSVSWQQITIMADVGTHTLTFTGGILTSYVLSP